MRQKKVKDEWKLDLYKRLTAAFIFLGFLLFIHSNPSLFAGFFSTIRTTSSSHFQAKSLPLTSLNVYSLTPPPLPASDNQPWGVAKQLSDHIWTIKLGQDERMATPGEILIALNNYRARFGSQPLTWDAKLASYAQSRADFFNSKGDLDSHAGFEDYLNHQDGFSKLGFNSIGENSSIGYKLIGVHIIEWVYASDLGHDSNQKDKNWDHVGIGVSKTATDLIFATSPR